MRNGVVFLCGAAVLVGLYIWYDVKTEASAPPRSSSLSGAAWYVEPVIHAGQYVMGLFIPPEKPLSNVLFDCSDQKNFRAIFYPGNVHVHLSDGRDFILSAVASTSATVYVASSGSPTFVEQHGVAFIEENGSGETYQDCSAGTSNYS